MWWKAQHGRILGTPGGWNPEGLDSENREQGGPPTVKPVGARGSHYGGEGPVGNRCACIPAGRRESHWGFTGYILGVKTGLGL